MRLRLVACLALPLLCSAQPVAPPLKLIQTITLPPDIRGPFDHFGVDLPHNRLFATPENNKVVLVIDITTGKLLHTIAGLAKPHAVLYRDDLNRLYVTDGIDGDLKIFDASTYALTQRVKLLKDADSIGYDPSTQLLYIDNGGGDEGQTYSELTSVDTTSGQKVTDLPIDGATLEAMALDLYRDRLYLNNKTKNRIEVVNRWKNKVIGSWPITLGQENVALALDEPHQRLFVGCRSGHIVIFDTNTGQQLQALSIPKGIDDLTYDVSTKRLYAAADGSVTIYAENDADHFTQLATVPTSPGARTARLVPQRNRYFVAAPPHDSEPAAILVFETTGTNPIATPAPDAPAYTVHAPRAESLLRETLSSHPGLRKMGLHAVAPGQTDSVIIANGNATRIGVKTTPRDFAAVQSGSTYTMKIADGSFYNTKMPMFDAAGRRIGILVMEIPFTSASSEAAAIQLAENIRRELAAQIPSLDFLFAAN